VLECGSDGWTIRKINEKRLSALEMKFIRAAGYRLLDRKQNEFIKRK
jgi:hypothetical protein